MNATRLDLVMACDGSESEWIAGHGHFGRLHGNMTRLASFCPQLVCEYEHLEPRYKSGNPKKGLNNTQKAGCVQLGPPKMKRFVPFGSLAETGIKPQNQTRRDTHGHPHTRHRSGLRRVLDPRCLLLLCEPQQPLPLLLR